MYDRKEDDRWICEWINESMDDSLERKVCGCLIYESVGRDKAGKQRLLPPTKDVVKTSPTRRTGQINI